MYTVVRRKPRSAYVRFTPRAASNRSAYVRVIFLCKFLRSAYVKKCTSPTQRSAYIRNMFAPPPMECIQQECICAHYLPASPQRICK